MRLQIAITAICSLEICQLVLNVSVKDKKVVHPEQSAKQIGPGYVKLLLYLQPKNYEERFVCLQPRVKKC